jgi:hypothetical protein
MKSTGGFSVFLVGAKTRAVLSTSPTLKVTVSPPAWAIAASATRVVMHGRDAAERNRLVLALAALLAAVPFLMAASGQQVVKAEKFEVTKNGVVVAALTSDDDGGSLDVFNKEGKLVANLMTSEQQARGRGRAPRRHDGR